MAQSLIHDKIIENTEVWLNRTDEENSKINTSWLESHVLPFDDIKLNAKTWIFSHIPKTAGTALESYLVQAFKLKDVFNVNSDELNNLPESLYLKNRFPKFITGYHPIQGLLYQLLEDQKMVHITMMRDPIERFICYYNSSITDYYRLNNTSHKALDMDEFINQADLKEVHNGQAKRLAGLLDSSDPISDKDLYFRAKYNVDHCFTMVGVTEFFTQYHKLIAKKCGFVFHDLPPITRLETKVKLASLKPEQLKMIKAKNKIDIQLYQYVRSKFLSLLS